MLENTIKSFKSLDVDIFYLINGLMKNEVFDVIMPFITRFENFYTLFGIIAIILVFLGGKYGRLTLILILITVLLSDFINSQILKDIFARHRPCNVLPDVNLLVKCTKSFSFPSSHSVNITAGSTILAIRYRWTILPLLIIIFLVCFSRIYVGVHFPFDTIAGVIFGYFFALTINSLANLISTYKLSLKQSGIKISKE